MGWREMPTVEATARQGVGNTSQGPGGWLGVALGTTGVALVVYVLIALGHSMAGAADWEVTNRAMLIGGLAAMGVASVFGARVAVLSWRRTRATSTIVLGGLLVLLAAVVGALLLRASVAYFPGPLQIVPTGFIERAPDDVRMSVSSVCAADVPTCEDVLMYDFESGACVTNVGRSCDKMHRGTTPRGQGG